MFAFSKVEGNLPDSISKLSDGSLISSFLIKTDVLIDLSEPEPTYNPCRAH